MKKGMRIITAAVFIVIAVFALGGYAGKSFSMAESGSDKNHMTVTYKADFTKATGVIFNRCIR